MPLNDIQEFAAEAISIQTGHAKRILFISPAGIGGTVQYTHNLANALAELGHETVLATAIKNELAPFRRSYHLIGVFDRFKLHPGPFKQYLGEVRRFRPDIVHFQGAQRPEFYLLMWALLRLLTNARFVWTPQDVVSNSVRPYHRRLLRLVYSKMEHVFLNARQNVDPVTEEFGVESTRLTVLPIPDLLAFVRQDLGRSLPAEFRLSPEKPMLLCFGLIEERKGIGTLIEAFADVRQKGVDATLLIMGKALLDVGPFEELISRTGLDETQVQLVARYAEFEEMNALFMRAAAVVLPYHKGWNSGVLAAAQGYGCPVVATTVGGFDEVVADEETGLLVPPRDAKALGAAMLRVITDTELRHKLAEGSIRAGRQSSWDTVAEETAQKYARILLPDGASG